MKIFLKLRRHWGAIRWKMLIIFVFFSVISMSLVGCFAVAVLNVVLRRESAYLVEERIKLVVYQRKELIELRQGRRGRLHRVSIELIPVDRLFRLCMARKPSYCVALDGVQQIRTCLGRHRRFCGRRLRQGPS